MSEYGRRYQRSRKAGARLPEGTIYIGRSAGGLGRWGNPFRVTGSAAIALAAQWKLDTWRGRQWSAVKIYALWIAGRIEDLAEPVRIAARSELEQQGNPVPPTLEQIETELRWERSDGKDICCWCSPFVDCHGDILIAAALGRDPVAAAGTSPLLADNFRHQERNREFARREIRENIRRRANVKGWTVW